MHYSKYLTNIRSLRYFFLLLTLGVVAVALAVADSPVPTQTALQPSTPQRRQLNETPAPSARNSPHENTYPEHA
jgi:hypothetical protein